jgi:hypothetical protein
MLRAALAACVLVLVAPATAPPAAAWPRYTVSPFVQFAPPRAARAWARLHRAKDEAHLLEGADAAPVPAPPIAEPEPPAPAALIVVGAGDPAALCRARGFLSGERERVAGMTQTRCTR